MGKKIRPRGATIALPYLNEAASEPVEVDFRNRVLRLCPEHSFDDETLTQLYLAFGAVIGKWLSEWGQPELVPIARRLASTARFLEQLAEGLAGVQTGLRQSEDIEFALLARRALSLNPLVGDSPHANEKLNSFQRQCSEMAQVFWVALKLLNEQHGKRGRPNLEWYDDFTAVLLKLAKLANIKPNLNKDRETGARGGWLFDAAQKLESFLYPPMRSDTLEACGKRLERSLKRLRGRFEIGCQACNSSSKALASFRSRVSKPSVNQP
jgi:hypothetical protein